nr:hypothetical protein [Tanacetum cinerariifolium]
MSSASSAVTYTSVYTDFEPRRVFWGADEELSDRGSPRVIVYGYDGLPMMPVATPSPDYIPGPEEPQTPPAPQDEDEHQLLFIQPHDLDFPLPPVVSPTAESLGYVAESDPEEDPKDYEEDEAQDGPDEDNEDEDEEEEHLAPADAAVVIHIDELISVSLPPKAEVEILLAMPTPSPSPPSAGERLARCTALAALPSPPLPPFSYPPPPADRKDGIPESEQPPRKRLCLSTLGSRYEVGESSTRGRGVDYGFTDTVEAEMRHRGIREVGYRIRDTWIDLAEAVPDRASTTLEKVNTRVVKLAELHEHDTQDLYALLEDAHDVTDSRDSPSDERHEMRDGRHAIRVVSTTWTAEESRTARRGRTRGKSGYTFPRFPEYFRANVFNAPREPYVVKQDNGSFIDNIIFDLNRAPDSPHLHTISPNQFHCFHCKDVLRDEEANQVKFATCTLLDAALTWWNGQIQTLGPEAYAMTWEVLKKKMMNKYSPQGKLKKLEIELWNLKIKGNDVPTYTNRFQELTLMCTKLVANESEKIDKYINESIELTNDLMDQKLRTYAERADNKRKTEDTSRNNHGHQQQPFKKQNVAKVYNMGTGKKKPYEGSFPKSSDNANVANAPRDSKETPKGNGWVYAVGNAEKNGNAPMNPDSNVVTGTFLLNNRYASILFDTGADRSFISIAFSSLVNIEPTPLGSSYDVELADGKIVRIDIIIRGCTINFLNHPFNIDLMPVELGSFDVIIRMDWLRRCHAVIVCDEKVVQIPYGNETLTFHGNESNNGRESQLTVISCSQAQRYMAKGCQTFMTQISAKKGEDKDYCCSKGNVEDKILVPKLPKNNARCRHSVNGSYCQGCALLRKKLEEDLVTHSQDFQNTSESSDDSTNVVNAPREPFIVKQDHGSFIDKIICDLNKAPHLYTFSPNQFHCFHCKDVSGDGEACQRCTCTRCGSGLSKGLCLICGNNQNSINDSPSISANSSQNPLHINERCYECGDALDGIFCQRCTCFDQTKTPQFPVIHPPTQETSIEILHDQENVINSVQTFLRKFNRYSFFKTPKVLLLAWDRVFEIKDAFGNGQYKPEDIQELFRKLLDDLQNIHEELAKYINTPGWNRPAFYNNGDDDDVDYTIAITPVLSTEEPGNSLSMGDEHLDTIPGTKSDEVINDDDSLYYESIEYVEASPHDYEVASLEVAKIVIPEDEEIEDDNLREKLLNVNRLIAKIEALKENPTPSFEFLTKSPSIPRKSFLEETNTFHNSLPEFENFYFDLEEISSGSTTTHSDISLPDYEAFSFYDDHIKDISSGSTTIHYDISLSEYDSFIFDLSNDQFPPTDRSDFTHEEFGDELAHIISPPEYDCFYFGNSPDLGEWIFSLNSKIRKNLSSTTCVNLPVEDDHSPLLTYVVWIFLAYLTYYVIPPHLHSFGNEDTIFDPGITINRFYSFKPGLSHQFGTFKKFNTHCSQLNKSLMEMLFPTLIPMDQ